MFDERVFCLFHWLVVRMQLVGQLPHCSERINDFQRIVGCVRIGAELLQVRKCLFVVLFDDASRLAQTLVVVEGTVWRTEQLVGIERHCQWMRTPELVSMILARDVWLHRLMLGSPRYTDGKSSRPRTGRAGVLCSNKDFRPAVLFGAAFATGLPGQVAMRRLVAAAGLVVLVVVVAGCESESDRYYGRLNRAIDTQERIRAAMPAYQACVDDFKARKGQNADATDACRHLMPK